MRAFTNLIPSVLLYYSTRSQPYWVKWCESQPAAGRKLARIFQDGKNVQDSTRVRGRHSTWERAISPGSLQWKASALAFFFPHKPIRSAHPLTQHRQIKQYAKCANRQIAETFIQFVLVRNTSVYFHDCIICYKVKAGIFSQIIILLI